MSRKTVRQWVDELQANGRYTFLRSEAVVGTGLAYDALTKALRRLATRKRVVKIKNYFYVIVPLEYRHSGCLPASWFIDDLMKAIGQDYYVALLTAASVHGSAHQQPQEFQVITDKPVRPIRAGRLAIRFFTSHHISHGTTISTKTPTGFMKVSTPETTCLDLVRFQKSVGNMHGVANVCSELIPHVAPSKLLRVVRAYGDTTVAQRLGYLLEQMGAFRHAAVVHRWLQGRRRHTVPLCTGQKLMDSSSNLRWNVIVGEPIEIET